MANSAQITDAIQKSADPRKSKQTVWAKTRYLVAQNAAADDFTKTTTGYFEGRMVVPGPKANPKFGMLADVENLEVVENKYYIRFTDSATTDNADVSVGRALYTVMTDAQADAYEKVLAAEWNGPKGEAS